jgi:hypothetical protein
MGRRTEQVARDRSELSKPGCLFRGAGAKFGPGQRLGQSRQPPAFGRISKNLLGHQFVAPIRHGGLIRQTFPFRGLTLQAQLGFAAEPAPLRAAANSLFSMPYILMVNHKFELHLLVR